MTVNLADYVEADVLPTLRAVHRRVREMTLSRLPARNTRKARSRAVAAGSVSTWPRRWIARRGRPC